MVKLLLFCFIIFIGLSNAAVTIVDANGEQTTSSETKAKAKQNPQQTKTKKPHSAYNIMWITPFEIFNISTPDDHIIDPSINKVMSSYAEYLYNRFITGLNDGTINLNIDSKASLNDKFFALQQHLHENNNLHGSDAVPKREFTMLKLQIKNVVNMYLKRCGVDNKVIKNALRKITIDGGNDENKRNIDPKNKMFLWATMLYNGTYHAPHSHEDSIVSGVYFARIPTTKIDANSDDNTGGYLVLGDPRGAGIYPFGLKYIHIPIEGQIVLFPAYLTHWVEPAKTSEARISFAFNIPGSWDDLSDTSMVYNF